MTFILNLKLDKSTAPRPPHTHTQHYLFQHLIVSMVKKICNNYVLSCLQSKSLPLCKFIFSVFLFGERTAGCHLPNTVTIPHTLEDSN